MIALALYMRACLLDCCILLVNKVCFFYFTFLTDGHTLCAALHRYIFNNISGARKHFFSLALLLNTGIIHFVTSSKTSSLSGKGLGMFLSVSSVVCEWHRAW